MIYLDYSANTPVNPKVLEVFVSATQNYIANPNSSHLLGIETNNQIKKVTENISNFFNCLPTSIIYTSGSTESNNLIIKGMAQKYPHKKIIISEIEHSSIIAPCNFLLEQDYDIEIIPIKENGEIDLQVLEEKIDNNTILVSICTVDSELGCVQPIEKIANIVHKFPNCYFHTDATQAIGKINIDYSCADFITCSPHKFFGLNGTGVLINKQDISLIPQIHGGKSTTPYRSGTPVTANILAFSEALNLTKELTDQNTLNYISILNKTLREKLKSIEDIHINSPENAMPHILNFSFNSLNAKKIVEKLATEEIYVSTSSACSLDGVPSKSVLAITKNLTLAKNSVRVSLSKLTTLEEINFFFSKLQQILKNT